MSGKSYMQIENDLREQADEASTKSRFNQTAGMAAGALEWLRVADVALSAAERCVKIRNDRR